MYVRMVIALNGSCDSYFRGLCHHITLLPKPPVTAVTCDQPKTPRHHSMAFAFFNNSLLEKSRGGGGAGSCGAAPVTMTNQNNNTTQQVRGEPRDRINFKAAMLK